MRMALGTKQLHTNLSGISSGHIATHQQQRKRVVRFQVGIFVCETLGIIGRK